MYIQSRHVTRNRVQSVSRHSLLLFFILKHNKTLNFKNPRTNGTRARRDGFKPINSLEWRSVVASMRLLKANVNLVVQWKERLEAP